MTVEIERKYLVANDKAHLNIKSVTLGISRSEYENEISLGDGEEMLANLTADPIIDKVRYRVRCGGHIWDLDLFHGDNEGLIVAEIELAAEDEAFELPEWVGEEVFGDPKYYNACLVKHPYCDW